MSAVSSARSTSRATLYAPDGVIQVIAQVATCDADSPHPACHLTRQDWGVPVRVAPGGDRRLALVLRGLDSGD